MSLLLIRLVSPEGNRSNAHRNYHDGLFPTEQFQCGLFTHLRDDTQTWFMPEFQIWTIGLQIVRLSCGGDNELGMRTQEHLVRSISSVLLIPRIFHCLLASDTCTKPIRRGIGDLRSMVTGDFGDLRIRSKVIRAGMSRSPRQTRFPIIRLFSY